jgi:hypothetical protein
MRGNVPRSGYGKREIDGIASTEEPWRLEAQLQLLARAAMAFGRTEEEAVTLARSVALGTVPPDRMRVLKVLADGKQHNASRTGKETGMDRGVVTRALEDLQQLGVTECVNEDPDSDEGGPMEWGQPKLWQYAGTTEAKLCARVI